MASQAAIAPKLSTTEITTSTGVYRFNVAMALTAVSLSAIVAVLFRLESISVTNLHLGLLLFQCGIPIVSLVAYCHWAGLYKMRDGCAMIGWAILFVNLLQLPQYAAARSTLQLHDDILTRADLLMGIDCGAIVRWTQAHHLEGFSAMSYGLLYFIVGAAVLIPSVTGRIERVQRFIVATIIAALVASIALAIFPARGPWVGFGFEPSANEEAYSIQSYLLRRPGEFIADRDFNTGFITFPSFHVALAVLSVYALWPFRWLRIPVCAVAALIAIATVTTGWHYASDGIAGIALALGSVRLVSYAVAAHDS